MAQRSRAREVALQLLFQFDMNPGIPRAIVERFARERLRNSELLPFCMGLYDGSVTHRREIDAQLTVAADNWRLARMTAVDRNVLRLGAYELLFANETPAPIALDEAIELARRYGSKDSPSFVNGVLDKINQTKNAETPAPTASAAAE
jgi:N utilization substance protein B